MSKFRRLNTKASKLNADQVFEIRRRYGSRELEPVTMEQLSREFQVSLNTIRNIIHGVTWQSVPGFVTKEDVDYEAARSQELLQAMLASNPPKPQEEASPDPVAEILSRAEPLSVSMQRIYQGDPVEHAQRMQGLKALAEHTSDSASDSKENPNAADVRGSQSEPGSDNDLPVRDSQ